MRKLILIGRSEAGKSTLIQALRNEDIQYHKTQSVDYTGSIIDTPGEYAETSRLGGALAVFSYEAGRHRTSSLGYRTLQFVSALYRWYGDKTGNRGRF